MWRARVVTGVFFSTVLSMTLLMSMAGQADLWRCSQRDQPITFQESGGPGCRAVKEEPFSQSTISSGNSLATEQWPPLLIGDPASLSPVRQWTGQTVSSHPLLPALRVVPAVSLRDLPPEWRERGWSLPNKGDIQLLQIDVRYLKEGNGPVILTSDHFMHEARQTLEVAVRAAAVATRYDPRFLSVHLTIPMPAVSLYRGIRVEGASAGAFWAVAIASAILGDELRQDLCFSGTINEDLSIGPVEGLEQKIDGCCLLRQFRELLVPAGQKTFALVERGMAHSLVVTEVSTLAEAYEIATGRPLRSAQAM
ncbi:MAG: S16 family serine protease [Nitrospira sp.]